MPRLRKGAMRELRVILLAADAERFRGALMLAAAQTALGGRASLFLQTDAVALLTPGRSVPGDVAHRAAGLPSLAELLAEALAQGVAVTACQTGLALCGLRAQDLPEGIAAGGPVGFLAETDDAARLVFA